ncbi:beta-ketoacyl synthase N-terminal-like domain-containing protein [Streptomyces sp. NPDC054841]
MSGTELAVTGVGVVSPWGDTPQSAAPSPRGDDWFDARERLGPRGYKYQPAAAQYALAAARGALADGGSPDAVPADRRGLLLATNAGLAGLFDTMDATVTETGADALSPATAPYFAVNVLGNRLAAELGLKGFALTVASPRTAAVDALAVGARALASARCDTLVLAATEAPLPGTHGDAAGEQGGVALTLEPPAAARRRGARTHAVIRARSVFVPPRALRTPEGRTRADAALSAALAALLGAPAPGLEQPLAVRLLLDGSGVADAAAHAVAAVRGPLTEAAAEATGPYGSGHTGCLGPAIEVARAVTAGGGGTLVVTATGAGHVALVLVSPHHTQESAC